jgi:hypothetical protein
VRSIVQVEDVELPGTVQRVATSVTTPAETSQAVRRWVPMKAHNGDWLVIEPVRVGEHRRRGLVTDVRGTDGEPPYRVRWTDTDRETLFFPGEGAHIVPAAEIGRHAAG